jgi:hypothetical protein
VSTLHGITAGKLVADGVMALFCCQFQDENEHGLQDYGQMPRDPLSCLRNQPKPLMENLGLFHLLCIR